MMIEKTLESASNIANQSKTAAGRHSIVEFGSGEHAKRIIVPYSRQQDIERWFYDTTDNSDYVFETDNSGEPHTVIRLSRSTAEIRFTEITRSKLLSKSLEYILLSNIPAFISFVSALLLVGLVWAYTSVNAFLKHEKLTSELMEPARGGTLNIALFFLLIYAIIFIVKTLKITHDRFYAVREFYDISFMSSLVFNVLLVALIGLVGIDGLFDMIISFLA